MAVTILPRKLTSQTHEFIIFRRDPDCAVGVGRVGNGALAADVGVVVLGGVRGVGERRGGPLDGVLDVEHGVVDAGGVGQVVGTEVEEGEESGY